MTAYYQFDNAPFAPLIPDGMIPIPSGEYNYGLRHIPWSDSDVLDLGGRSARHYSARIRCTVANYVAMDNLLGTTATLTLGGIEYDSATLVKLNNVAQTPRGEYVEADAEFVL